MASSNSQCDKCIHKEMCKWTDIIAKLKEQHSFISSISCAHCAKGQVTTTGKTKKPIVQMTSEINTESSEPAENNVNNEETTTTATEPNTTDDGAGDEVNSIMDVGIEHLGLHIAEIVPVLDSYGIKTVRDIYDYNLRREWSSIQGMTPEYLNALNQVLTALGQPELKAWM